jgi:hypothetical protein
VVKAPKWLRNCPFFFEVPGTNDPLEGRYANFFKVGHNSLEFILDFGQVYSGGPSEMIYHTRIVTSPAYARVLLEVLQEAVQKYQQSFGPIPEPQASGEVERPQ